MSNRRHWAGGVCLAVSLLTAAWFEPTYCIRGWLRGEAFYQGRPTSYWAREILHWQPCVSGSTTHGAFTFHSTYYTRRQDIPAILTRFVPASFLGPSDWPPLFDGDAAGLPVLKELLEHPDPHVSLWAKEGIERIQTGPSGPMISEKWFPEGGQWVPVSKQQMPPNLCPGIGP